MSIPMIRERIRASPERPDFFACLFKCAYSSALSRISLFLLRARNFIHLRCSSFFRGFRGLPLTSVFGYPAGIQTPCLQKRRKASHRTQGIGTSAVIPFGSELLFCQIVLLCFFHELIEIVRRYIRLSGLTAAGNIIVDVVGRDVREVR